MKINLSTKKTDNDKNNAIASIVSSVEKVFEERFGETPAVALRFAPDDFAWYTPANTILIDFPNFSKEPPEKQIATLAHECCHHLINTGWCDSLNQKYGDKLKSEAVLNEETVADFIVQYELNIDIAKFRDNDRKEGIEYLKKDIDGKVSNGDMLNKASSLC